MCEGLRATKTSMQVVTKHDMPCRIEHEFDVCIYITMCIYINIYTPFASSSRQYHRYISIYIRINHHFVDTPNDQKHPLTSTISGLLSSACATTMRRKPCTPGSGLRVMTTFHDFYSNMFDENAATCCN